MTPFPYPFTEESTSSKNKSTLPIDPQQPELEGEDPNPSPSLQQVGACGIAVHEHFSRTLTDLSSCLTHLNLNWLS